MIGHHVYSDALVPNAYITGSGWGFYRPFALRVENLVLLLRWLVLEI